MRNLLAIWQVHGLDRMLRDAWERGVVRAGLSAGAMCWMRGGVAAGSARLMLGGRQILFAGDIKIGAHVRRETRQGERSASVARG